MIEKINFFIRLLNAKYSVNLFIYHNHISMAVNSLNHIHNMINTSKEKYGVHFTKESGKINISKLE